MLPLLTEADRGAGELDRGDENPRSLAAGVLAGVPRKDEVVRGGKAGFFVELPRSSF
jgi:hypothetical protein